MTFPEPAILIGTAPYHHPEKTVSGEYVTLLGETFYKIQHYDAMRPFFMSIVSSSNHWLFISSTGGLSAGRGDAERALFPYYTEDKLTENSENTGSKIILLVSRGARTSLWEPFSYRQQGAYRSERHLYKNIAGTALVFEEINLDLGLVCRYAWRTSEKFGFVKTTWLTNTAESNCRVEALDGLQNILPANTTQFVQNIFSCLLDAYKRSELDPETGLGIFALNSILTDLAEPRESLLATTVAQLGLTKADYLLSSAQLDRFRAGERLAAETEVRGGRGAYFVHTRLDLAPQDTHEWHLIADVQQDSVAIVQRLHGLKGEPAQLWQELEADISAGQQQLWAIVASADGLQCSRDLRADAFHFSNVMFNVMRGGIPADQYWVHTADFIEFVALRNRATAQAHASFFAALPAKLPVWDLQARITAQASTDLIRLSYSFLPLVFSRRHGDPSRPWNRFAIDLKRADGSPKLHFEGNWRDIFQNWEALAYSYPEFVESMVSLFLNSTTAEGYNPYRITYEGIDWEVPEPHNPWANIGYWSDHQIIYLLTLMEISASVHPDKLRRFLNEPIFSYANVPYRIHAYEAVLKNPYNTIDFDLELHEQLETRCREEGTDAKLIHDSRGRVLHVSLAEKLLTLLLGKLANFVPEGGIWMNTQRPEWNDANNALVGKGLSVVTLSYLRRYLVFCRNLFANSRLDRVALSREVQQYFYEIAAVLRRFQPTLNAAARGGSFTDEQRRQMMDALGQAGSVYRQNFYAQGFSGESVPTPLADLMDFLDLARAFVEHSLRANQRPDRLYHAYNILHLAERRARVTPLYEMLEGQVAILSSGLLSGEESLALLRNLRQSALYRADQHSYLLYPDRQLPGFLARNSLTQQQINSIPLLAALVRDHNPSIMVADIQGVYHFQGAIRNFQDVQQRLEQLKQQAEYAALVEADSEKVRLLFEATFHHSEFTGRSGTFFAYEGLGSIYWHMVAKLLLAAQETALRFRDEPEAEALRACYSDIRQGLCFNKSPDTYGAFPTDAYSHTPKGQGAKQPGMTGFVKEVILTRQVELGYLVSEGKLVFDPLLLDASELSNAPAEFSYLDVNGQAQQLALEAGTLAYTICQIPIVLYQAERPCLSVHQTDGTVLEIDGSTVDEGSSRHIFQRDGIIHHLRVGFSRHAEVKQ